MTGFSLRSTTRLSNLWDQMDNQKQKNENTHNKSSNTAPHGPSTLQRKTKLQEAVDAMPRQIEPEAPFPRLANDTSGIILL